MELSVEVTQRETDSAVVTLTGELDLFSSHTLEGALTPLVADGCVHLVIDAVRLRFCDLAGVRVLERVHKEAVSASGGLIVWAGRSLGRLLALLWPEERRGRPTVVRVAPEAPARRPHLSLLRGTGDEAVPVPHPRLSLHTGVHTGNDVDSRERREALLERSRRLREEAGTRMRSMRERAELICTGLATAQERLAALHDMLDERRCRGLSCDGESHQARAAGFRRRAEEFARS